MNYDLIMVSAVSDSVEFYGSFFSYEIADLVGKILLTADRKSSTTEWSHYRVEVSLTTRPLQHELTMLSLADIDRIGVFEYFEQAESVGLYLVKDRICGWVDFDIARAC